MTTNNCINTSLPFSLASGGTGINLVASNGGIVWCNATTMAILAGTATASQVLLSGASATPSWSTATYPTTAAISTLLYASSTNVIAALATANHSALSTTSAGVPTWVALNDGQLLIGSTAGNPAAGAITAGTGITITNASGSITIGSTGGGLTWSTVTAATLAATVNTGIVANHAATSLVITLPATAAIGSIIHVMGLQGSGGWTLTANTAQTIQFGSAVSSSAGSWASTDAGDSAKAICMVANSVWSISEAVSSGLTVA